MKGVLMSTKTQYNTKQKKALLEYLETVPGEHITVSDVCEYLEKRKFLWVKLQYIGRWRN